MLGGCDYSLRGQTRESAQESGKQGYLYWQALGLVGNPISLNNMDVLPRTYPTINLKIPHTFAPTIVPTHMKTCMHTHKHENGKRQKRNQIKNLDISSHTYEHLLFDKETKILPG